MKTNYLEEVTDAAAKRKSSRITNKKSKTAEILFLSTFPPRECGIATYTADLILAIQSHFEHNFSCEFCALETNTAQFSYPEKPLYILNTQSAASFEDNLHKINTNEAIKLVVIQHEFGLFQSNELLFSDFISRLQVPVICVFHTVLPKPNAKMLVHVRAIAEMAQYVVVMTSSASRILQDDYQIREDKIEVISHGTHLPIEIDEAYEKQKLHLQNKKILTTFGLISESKCIETTIEALPKVVEKYPNVLFLLLGKTHPEVLRQNGEQYRQRLQNRIDALHLNANVRMIDAYLPLELLQTYLQLTDIYLFTSKDENQAVSGTFSYALAAGCPVISTPIPHAIELLDDENGLIVPFQNAEALSKAIINLLNNEELRSTISSNVFHKISKTIWKNSAIQHVHLFQKLLAEQHTFKFKIPEINLNHIEKLTDKFAMIQFSKLSNPDITTGYTLDDNARAIIAMASLNSKSLQQKSLDLIAIYLNFIAYCQQNDGSFLNYVNLEGKFTEQNFNENLDDSTGRALWALAVITSKRNFLPDKLVDLADVLLRKGLLKVTHIHSTRSMAFLIKAMVISGNPIDNELVNVFGNRLVQMYLHEKSKNWHWFESYLTYANSLLPEALLYAAQFTGNQIFKEIAIESFDFLLSRIFKNGKLRVVSNKGWQFKDRVEVNPIGGEQPIDVAYTIIALETFYNAIKEDKYKKRALSSFYWFLGDNHLQQTVYQEETGGCYDGVEESNVNLNQGAESTVSYLLARLAIGRLLH